MMPAASARRRRQTCLTSAVARAVPSPSTFDDCLMPQTNSRSLPSGISRIDQETSRTHGYFVRVGYRKTTKGWRPKASAFFGDASHGGKSSALRAAERWLRTTKRGMPKAKKSA